MTSNLDVTRAIQPKSDQLNADSLITGPRTIRIRDVTVNPDAEQPIWIYFDGDDGKPWKPCKTAARCLASIWGANAAQWIGLHCKIYNDPTVTWAGAAVGGIRVSHMEGLDKPRQLQLTKTRGKKGTVTIQPLILGDAPQEPQDETSLEDARAAAKKGRDEFLKWWGDNKDKQAQVKSIMDELKDLAAQADAAKDVDEDETPM